METPAAAPAADAAPARDPIASDLRSLVSDAQRLLQDVSRYDDAQIARLKLRLRDEIDRFGRQFTDIEAAAEARLKQAAQSTDEMVRDHPYTAISIAAAVGLFIGVLLARR